MGIITFNNITLSEKTARRYLLGHCWKNHQRHCPRCRERKLYKISHGKRRCARCLYTFHDFSRRFLSGCFSSSLQWIWFLKLFELEVAPKDMAAQLRCSYATVLKAQTITRRALTVQALDAPLLYTATDPDPGGAQPDDGPNSPIFGLVEVNGYAVCDILPDLSPKDLLHFKLNFRLRTASVGQIVYTAPYKQYQTLIGCGPALWPARYITHDDKGIPADGGGFWPYAKARIRRMRGVLPAHFPLYLKEWEWRYNHRGQALFPLLAQAVCAIEPSYRSEEKETVPDTREA